MSHNQIIQTLQKLEEQLEDIILTCENIGQLYGEFPTLMSRKEIRNVSSFHRNMLIIHRQIEIINRNLYNEIEDNIEEKIQNTLESYQEFTKEYYDIHKIIVAFFDKIKSKKQTG